MMIKAFRIGGWAAHFRQGRAWLIFALTALAFLRQHGCHIVQGYFYGRPMNAERFARFLESFAIDPATA